jgi:hypothetical protein
MLLKAEDLKWDDAVKKTFLSNTTLTQALIVISISVLYDEYIILLQWVSHNKLNSKDCYLRCCTTTTIITQQSYTDNMNWELTEHILLQLQKLKRDTEHDECQRRKWQNVVWNDYACTAETTVTSLRTANFCAVISHH